MYRFLISLSSRLFAQKLIQTKRETAKNTKFCITDSVCKESIGVFAQRASNAESNICHGIIT